MPRDIIILHICTINDNHMMHGSWDMEHDKQNFLSFWTIFCPFTPYATWKSKIMKKWKKTPEDIIILHTCTINYNHMMYGSGDMKHDGQNFLFWTNFRTFNPLKTWKIKFWKNEKKHQETISFFICVPLITIIWCMVPEIWRVTDRIFCHFGSFFALCPSNNMKNQNSEKMKKNPGDIIILQ